MAMTISGLAKLDVQTTMAGIGKDSTGSPMGAQKKQGGLMGGLLSKLGKTNMGDKEDLGNIARGLLAKKKTGSTFGAGASSTSGGILSKKV